MSKAVRFIAILASHVLSMLCVLLAAYAYLLLLEEIAPKVPL